MIGSSVLFTLVRNGFPEVEIPGQVVAWADGQILHNSGDGVGRFPARSLLKPFQFLATEIPMAEKWIPALGSVSATEAQVAQIREWHPHSKVLHPPGVPMDEIHRVKRKLADQGPDVYCHTCFSKHTAIVESCEKRGWDPKTYLSPTHPFQKKLMETLSEIVGEDLSARETVTDGCQLPSPVLTLVEMAKLYQKLASAPKDSPLGRIRDAMLSAPEWIGGPGRTDTKLMQANPKRLVAKEGADGLLGVGLLPDVEFSTGVGIVAKVNAGFLPALGALAMSPVFETLGIKQVTEVPKGQVISFPAEKRCFDLSPRLEPGIAVWPGDVPYSREVSCETKSGSHLTLSSLRTTVHVGTHTDALNHFENVEDGIDRAPIERYLGTCEVVTVDVERGGLIEPKHVKGVTAPRVFFRTKSYPDPKVFNEDFVALSGPVVEWLADRGVVLVGIDTPSVDAFSSKDLPAHHATAKRKMAILEGIVLDGVPDGVYQMSAVPLKIAGGDASPVRVVLTR